MINIDDLYQRVIASTNKDGRMGAITNDSFNTYVSAAQNIVMNHYVNKIDRDLDAREALSPFELTTDPLVIVGGNIQRPKNCRYILAISHHYIKNGELLVKPAYPFRADELSMILSSPVRKPSIEKGCCYYRVNEKNISVWPRLNVAGCSVTYISEPPVAERKTKINAVTESEEYDFALSTDLKWRQKDIELFVEVICFYVDNELGQMTMTDLSTLTGGYRKMTKQE